MEISTHTMLTLWVLFGGALWVWLWVANRRWESAFPKVDDEAIDVVRRLNARVEDLSAENDRLRERLEEKRVMLEDEAAVEPTYDYRRPIAPKVVR